MVDQCHANRTLMSFGELDFEIVCLSEFGLIWMFEGMKLVWIDQRRRSMSMMDQSKEFHYFFSFDGSCCFADFSFRILIST